ncbi:MmgE/PrpD family protein [Pantoea phytobeneficialis]|uniref:2-methylcitrate dehydratase n=1 Tax=Pantoea phytobeneficialis TaxID=2052056 RepID=A0AAP9H9M8_9GAMM|nr:MmgE/PrpD family protein [Pantoea phytobeneficialis]MDO6406698.1 MmgE/PrpD family protein [Pantoea phytobeneficialis]QGR09228.1 2-methylcitrate dehydratase [Pantoea phytobeneficialis]
MTLTRALAERIVHSQPDYLAQTKAREGIRDFLAVSWPVLRGQVPDSGLPALRTVYGDGSIRSQALLLGYASHALDYDDFHADFRGHPSVVILPALFAWHQHQPQATPEQFLDAYAIGVEVAGRLGLAASQQHYALGYHNTATLGTLAAAAALARFLRLDVAATATLLGIAATQASGLRAQFGSAIKPLHAGFAAERAVAAAQLTLAGIDGKQDGVLEAFLAASSNGQAQPEKLSENWGTPWRIITPGLEFKPFPTCAGTHSAAEAARLLRQEWLASGQPLEALLDNIVDISVAFPPGGDIAASIQVPANGIEARFSLEYVIAAMLMYDDLRLEDFAEGDLNHNVMPLAAKVRRTPDESAPPDAINPALRFHEVTLSLKNGMQLRQRRTRQESLADAVDVAGKLRLALRQETAERQALLWQSSELKTSADLQALADVLRG